MIKIPPEVVEAAVNAYAGAIWDTDSKPLDYQHAMTAAIAAALNAWPDSHLHEWQRPWLGGMSGTDIILPLPTEASDE